MDLTVKKGFSPHVIYICVLPVFFLLFCLTYNPFGIKETFSVGPLSTLAHLSLLSCIILLVLICSRLLFWLCRSMKEMRWWDSMAWALIEMFVSSCFMGLYHSLMGGGEYMNCMGACVKYTFLILPYPYMIIVLLTIVSHSYESGGEAPRGESELIKFNDEHGKLKLVINPGAILFIKAEDNYIRINYLEGGVIKGYELRNSMRSIEENAARHGICRCQRSFYVNPKHIKVLRKDKDGFIYAELDLPDVDPIPVSKRYYDALSALL